MCDDFKRYTVRDANIRPALEEMYLTKTLQRFEKMKKDIEIIAGEYITLEGDGDYDKASQLIATKGIVSPILQKDLDRIAQAGIPKDIYFQQGLQTLGP